jgi:hypothetical protein
MAVNHRQIRQRMFVTLAEPLDESGLVLIAHWNQTCRDQARNARGRTFLVE